MSKLPDARYAKARFVQDLHARRDAQLAAEREAAPRVTEDQRTMRNSDLFRETFTPGTHTCTPRETGPRETAWDHAARILGGDDDAPRPPQADTVPAPVAAPIAPPMETRTRQEAISAEALFEQMQARLAATPEAVSLPPETLLRRAYRELPGAQRDALAAKVEAEDFGLAGYFTARNFGQDYVSVLVGHSLAKRYADAVRLQPGLSPADLLQQMIGTES